MCLPVSVALKKKKTEKQTEDIKESFIVKIDRTYSFTFFQVYRNSQSRNFFMSVIPADRLFIN